MQNRESSLSIPLPQYIAQLSKQLDLGWIKGKPISEHLNLNLSGLIAQHGNYFLGTTVKANTCCRRRPTCTARNRWKQEYRCVKKNWQVWNILFNNVVSLQIGSNSEVQTGTSTNMTYSRRSYLHSHPICYNDMVPYSHLIWLRGCQANVGVDGKYHNCNHLI